MIMKNAAQKMPFWKGFRSKSMFLFFWYERENRQRDIQVFDAPLKGRWVAVFVGIFSRSLGGLGSQNFLLYVHSEVYGPGT